jgi:hypothetical protein
MRTSAPLRNLILKLSIHETTSIVSQYHGAWEYTNAVSLTSVLLFNENLRSLSCSLRNKLINTSERLLLGYTRTIRTDSRRFIIL